MANVPHHVYQDGGDYYADWDNIAHEVIVDGEEYIQVEEMDNDQYIGAHDANYVQEYDPLHQHPLNVSNHSHHHGQHHIPVHQMSHSNMDLLPLRPDGTPVLTMHMNDLLSKTYQIPGGSNMITCFNKKCQSQIAYEGKLYTLNGMLNPMAYNIWRCTNDSCTGALRTSPNFAAAKLRSEHIPECPEDDIQIRTRIAIFDLCLLAEFTDCNLHTLYVASTQKLKKDSPELSNAFPPFAMIQGQLEHHRIDQTFRKRFEYRKVLNQRRREGLVIERSKFKRTKAFPPSICAECNMDFPSGDLAPSQDLLIQHLTYVHERPLVIERYTFPDPHLFDQWIRELGQHSRYRMRKVGLYDEHMYYLCTSDDRQQRCNHGRGSIINTQCSAFIRVHDWRYILRKEMRNVIVDYCLDHCFHTGESPLPDSYRQPLYDYYSPEVFMKEIESRRNKTQKMLSHGGNSIRAVRRLVTGGQETDNGLNGLMEETSLFGGHARSQPVEEVYLMDQYNAEIEGQEWPGDEAYEQQGINLQPTGQTGRVTFNLSKNKEILIPREAVDNRASTNYVTVRGNFEDRSTFEAVLQLELQCDVIKQRMQQCRRPDVAKKYLMRLTGLVDDILADPHCSPKSNGVILEEDLPGPSTSRLPLKVRATGGAGPAPKMMRTIAAVNQMPRNSPVREAMFLKKDQDGKMVVVRRAIRKTRKMQVMPGEEVVQPAGSSSSQEVKNISDLNAEDSNQDEQEQMEVIDEGKLNEPPTNFLEPPRRNPARIRRSRVPVE